MVSGVILRRVNDHLQTGLGQGQSSEQRQRFETGDRDQGADAHEQPTNAREAQSTHETSRALHHRTWQAERRPHRPDRKMLMRSNHRFSSSLSAKRKILPVLSCLVVVFLFVLTGPLAAQQGIEVSAAGIVGANAVVQGNEIQFYATELQDNGATGRTVTIGSVPLPTEGITFTLSDLTVATGIVPADFTGINLYHSTDNVLDGGDTFLKTQAPVVIGVPMLVSIQGIGAANRLVPLTPGSRYFLLTADIAPGATDGHTFRFSVAGNHIDMRDNAPPGPPINYALGAPIGALDVNYIEINATGVPSGSSTGAGGRGGGATPTMVGVPFDSPWLLAMLVGGYGLWALLRRP